MAPYRFEVNTPAVAYEDFGPEAVLLNLETGAYFSLADRAKVFFAELVSAKNGTGFVAALGARDGETGAQATGMMQELQDQGLVRAAPATDVDTDLVGKCDAVLASPPGFTFDGYTDLADVIAADPIHDFDATTGMPVAAHV